MNFKNLIESNDVFRIAFTHPSVNKDSKLQSYQRLELLGDKVLGMILIEHLLEKYPDESEGVISVMLANLACTETLSHIATKLEIGDLLIIDKGEENLGGRTNKNNLEDCLEALIGAIYKEFGMDEARSFIIDNWGSHISDKLKIETQDPKSKLQEEMQKRGYGLPVYELISTEGSAHTPIFTYRLTLDEENIVTCSGASKKESHKLCAKEMLLKLEKIK